MCGTYQGSNLGQSVFDYVEKQHARNPLFFNFMYTPDFEHPVLRPQSHLPCLEVCLVSCHLLLCLLNVSLVQIWNYYLDENLHNGPSYDPEVIQMDTQQEEEAEAADGSSKSSRKIVALG